MGRLWPAPKRGHVFSPVHLGGPERAPFHPAREMRPSQGQWTRPPRPCGSCRPRFVRLSWPGPSVGNCRATREPPSRRLKRALSPGPSLWRYLLQAAAWVSATSPGDPAPPCGIWFRSLPALTNFVHLRKKYSSMDILLLTPRDAIHL